MVGRSPAAAAACRTDPTELYRARDGVYAGDLLIAAVAGLDFFSWLSGRRADLSEICDGLAIRPRPADVMCTLFASMGLIEREGDRFRLTELAAEHLIAGSPFDMREYLASLQERPACRELLEVLRTGEPAGWSTAARQEWAEEMENEEFAVRFTSAMDARGAYLGPALAAALDLGDARHVLDIAGGSGVYACALVDRFPLTWKRRSWSDPRSTALPGA